MSYFSISSSTAINLPASAGSGLVKMYDEDEISAQSLVQIWNVFEYDQNTLNVIGIDTNEEAFDVDGSSHVPQKSIKDRIIDLNSLHETGLITKDEYEYMRKEILGDI